MLAAREAALAAGLLLGDGPGWLLASAGVDAGDALALVLGARSGRVSRPMAWLGSAVAAVGAAGAVAGLVQPHGFRGTAVAGRREQA